MAEVGGGTVSYGANVFLQDPDFVNAAAYDFTLGMVSPLRGAGVALPDVLVDIAMHMRPDPVSTGSDIGAYEAGLAGVDSSGTIFRFR